MFSLRHKLTRMVNGCVVGLLVVLLFFFLADMLAACGRTPSTPAPSATPPPAQQTQAMHATLEAISADSAQMMQATDFAQRGEATRLAGSIQATFEAGWATQQAQQMQQGLEKQLEQMAFSARLTAQALGLDQPAPPPTFTPAPPAIVATAPAPPPFSENMLFFPVAAR